MGKNEGELPEFLNGPKFKNAKYPGAEEGATVVMDSLRSIKEIRIKRTHKLFRIFAAILNIFEPLPKEGLAMIEEDRQSLLGACPVCGFKADTLGCPRCAERREELREREACGYEGEAPYFQLSNQPFTPEEIAILKRLAKEEDKHGQ